MVNLKRAVIPGIAGVTIGALLLGAYATQNGPSMTALAAPSSINPAATASRSTSFQVVNMGTATATAVVKFFDQQTQSILQDYQPSQSLAPGGSLLLDQRFDNKIASGFAGSAVAESSQKLAAIVNEVTADGGVDGYNAVGSDEVTTSSVCPFVTRMATGQAGRIYNTIVHVQNAGTNQASVKAEFFGLDGVKKDEQSLTIQAGASKSVVLETNTKLGDNFIGSVSLSADQPIAAAAEQYSSKQLVDYTCFGSGAKTVYAPAIFRLDGLFGTSTQVANLSNTTANVTLEFIDSTQPTRNVTISDTIPARSMKFYDQRFDNGGKPVQNGFFGKLKATANQEIAIIVQEVAKDEYQAAAYRGIPSDKVSLNVVLPLIYSQIVDSTTGINFNTGFIVDNPNTSVANLKMTFTKSDGTTQTATWPLPANSSQNFEQRPNLGPNSIFATAGNFGSVRIESNVPVGAIVNQVTSKEQENDTRFNDAFIGYNAIPAS